ncbi:response regulator transcription factor [Egicoccus sp. AB-alg6-2]|uniref:response regulator transcription factor n=1 Tax=Egicoccus sp. AB-alg6-2 TaxID=3242692 RepID=UPI00359D0711
MDDESALRLLMRTVLERSGRYEVVGEAEDGQAALTMAGELLPDLVLIDLSMPVMDGLAALPHLRVSLPAARLVVLSGLAGSAAADTARAAGADLYLHKGLGARELLAAIDAAA